MSKKPIKSSLFRFVTLRSPQAIEDKENKAGFVLPSDAVKGTDTLTALSAYYLAIDGVDQNDAAARKTALEGADSDPSFVLIDGKTSLKAISSDLYSFSSWLMRNKSYLSYALVVDNLNLPENYTTTDVLNTLSGMSLSAAQEAQVWDNLLYQTIYKTSTSLRERLIQMLVANQFVKEFHLFYDAKNSSLQEGEIAVITDQDEEEFRKRANASVVIEKEVLIARLENVQPESSMPSTALKALQNELTLSNSQKRIAQLRDTLKELDREEEIYNQENQLKYKADLALHEANVKTLYDNATPTIVNYTDPDTQAIIQIETYPDLVVPKFAYEPLAVDFQSTGGTFTKTVATENFLSTKTEELLQSQDFYGYKDFESLRATIKECIKKEEQTLLNVKTELEPKTVNVGGTRITVNPKGSKLDPLCFGGNLVCEGLQSAKKFSLNFRMFVENDVTSATLGDITLTHKDSARVITITGGDIAITNTQDATVRFEKNMINDAIADNETGEWEFETTLTLSNGDVAELKSAIIYLAVFEVGTNQSIFFFRGCATLTNGSSPSEPSVPSFNGVANLGIADFLRVEQEICCYVPGEVSHIENILAKEYKEKSTRSLVSSEITTEQTRETEVENLTDTTSTERNELSTEASTIIDQQNSTDFGASSYVNGEFPKGNVKYGANTSFGSSSSSATSNSNSQAQSYAQELTERALERVVQKTSSKRTSRVLREFEENNKHGFDNTKGEKHVTGVYRWVDKVYENQIVNYGKRLMYEFSIPEPSKFLKQALLTSDTTETTDSGLIVPKEPKSPNSLGAPGPIRSASDITENNYQMIAAEYNAEVEAYPNKEITIGEAFHYQASVIKDNRYENAAESTELDIPEGYKTVKAIAVYGNSGDGSTSGTNSKVAQILVGGTEVFNELIDIDPFVEKIPVSYCQLGFLSSSVNVSIECKLTDEAKEQWQNETYNAIMNAYYDRMNEYNDFMRAEQDLDGNSGEAERLKFNPGINRAMEKRELKRCAIELLTNGTDIQLAEDRYTESSNGIPSIKAGNDLQKDAAAIKFFEQVFDWEIMAYNLYPYYYNDSSAWEDLIQEPENGDPIFQSFMQSGMARMIVPVREGFEDAANWYQATGEIWNGQGLVTDINDELYLSTTEELLQPVGEPVGEPWKTRVPTSLTIVQAKSAYLDETGLPCDPDCGEITNITGTDLVISGGTGSNASDGVGADIVETDNNVA